MAFFRTFTQIYFPSLSRFTGGHDKCTFFHMDMGPFSKTNFPTSHAPEDEQFQDISQKRMVALITFADQYGDFFWSERSLTCIVEANFGVIVNGVFVWDQSPKYRNAYHPLEQNKMLYDRRICIALGGMFCDPLVHIRPVDII